MSVISRDVRISVPRKTPTTQSPKAVALTPRSASMSQRSIVALGLPVSKGSVVSSIIDRIRDALLRKDLRPGDYLPSEAELTKRLGVSRSSLREAIKMLQAMGVVEARRGQGMAIRNEPGADYISPLLFQVIMQSGVPDDLLELRLLFEPAASVLAMQRATGDDLARIREALERLETAVQAGTQTADDDLAFHHAMLRATRNPLVIRIGETIFELFRPSISISMNAIPSLAVKDHQAIYEAFVARDEARLRGAVLKSYEGWKSSLHRTGELRQRPLFQSREVS